MRLSSGAGLNREDVDKLMLLFVIYGSSKLSVRQMIKQLSLSESVPEHLRKTFRKSRNLLERWNYGVSETLEYLESALKHPKLKGLVIRLMHSIKAGVSIEDFARIEYVKHRAEQDNELEKGLEKLRRLVEAYTTLISVVSLLSVSFLLIGTIIGGGGASFLDTAFLSIVATLGSTTLLFLTNNLKRPIFTKYPDKPGKLKLLLKTTTPILSASVAILFLTLPLANSVGAITVETMSAILISVGTALFIHGYLGRRWHKKIHQTETMLPIVLKSFGDYLSATGSVKSSAHMLTLSDLGPLNRLVKAFEQRLRLGISQKEAIAMVGRETVGRLGENVFTILGEVIEAGARPATACGILSEYVSNVLFSDKRREQITSTLKTLSVPLHATLAAIYALLTTLLAILSKISALLENYLMLIRPIPSSTVVSYFYIIIAATSIITGLNIYLADGDSFFTLTYYLGLLLLVSGVSYLVMTNLSMQLLSTFIGLGESLKALTAG
ncbi:MAG: hypothetical protein QXS96_03775 [Candidatus Caldarchaeum sp.]